MKFKNYIEVQSGIKDSADSPGTLDQVLTSTATGVAWIDQDAIVSGSAERVSILVKNGEGAALVKGDPVYIIGSVGASARLEVGLCDASDPDKMPCVGLLEQDLLNNGEGNAVTAGKLRNLVTTPIDGQATSENDTIYVKAGGSSGSSLTTTKPTGSTNLIQNVGQVGRVSSSSDGNFVVSAIMRTNDVPNLPEGRIWVGDGNTIVSDTVFLDEPNGRMGIGTSSPAKLLEVKSSSAYNSTVRLSTSAHNWDIQGGEAGYSSTAFALDYDGTTFFRAMGTTDAKFSGGLSVGTLNATPPTGGLYVAGNVGIGTTSPTSRLELAGYYVASSISNVGANSLLTLNTTVNTGINLKAGITSNYNAYLQGYNAQSTSSRSLVLNPFGGNVGIGTDSPSYKLHIAQGEIGISNLAPSFTNAMGSIGAYNQDANNGGLIFKTIQGSTLSEKVRILANGNVGIGTNNPSAPLSLGNGGAESLELNHNISSSSRILSYNRSNNTYRQLQLDSLEHVFKTSSSERMRITSTGNVGIGTTSPNGKLTVVSNNAYNSGGGLRLQSSSGADRTLLYLSTDHTNQVSTIQSYRDGTGAGVKNLLINPQGGNVGIGTTSPGAKLDISDSIPILRITGTRNASWTIGQTMASLEYFSEDASGASANSVRASINLVNEASVYGSTTGLSFSTKGDIAGLPTEKMRITSAGSVGIGTTNPLAKTHIKASNAGGDSAASGTLIVEQGSAPSIQLLSANSQTQTIKFADPQSSQIGRISYSHPNDAMFFVTNGSERMRIDNNGNVGIGTTNPLQPLSIESSTSPLIKIRNTTNAGGAAIEFNDNGSSASTQNGRIVYRHSDSQSQGGGSTFELLGEDDQTLQVLNNGRIVVQKTGSATEVGYGFYNDVNTGMYSPGADTLALATGGSNRLHINSSGNVGIGTTSPERPLHVLNTSSQTVAIFDGGNNSASEIAFKDAATSGGTYVTIGSIGNNMSLSAGASEKMRITSGGNVGIGTTSPSSSNKLEVNGQVRVVGAQMIGDSATSNVVPTGVQLHVKNTGEAKIRIEDSDLSNLAFDILVNEGAGFSIKETVGGESGDNTRLFIQETTGNLGIGTTSPDSLLEISTTDAAKNFIKLTSAAGGVNPALIFEKSDLEQGVIQYIRNGDLKIYNTDSDGGVMFSGSGATNYDMYINNTGNVGIGTTSPSQKLEVIGRTKITQSGDALRINSSDANGPYVTWQNNGSNIGYIGAGYHLWSSPNNIATSLGIRAQTRLDLGIQSSVHMTMLDSGNVGIGTTSPSTKLHVVGSAGQFALSLQNSSNGDGIKITTENQTANNGFLWNQGSSNLVNMYSSSTTNASKMIMLAGGVDKIFFNTEGSSYFNGGNVGIGTTNPSQKLHIAGNMRLQNQLYDSTNSAGTNGEVLTKVSAGTEWKVPAVNAQMPDNTAPASAANVGTIRYRSTSNTSFMDMSMQTGATTYAWVNIVSNFW